MPRPAAAQSPSVRRSLSLRVEARIDRAARRLLDAGRQPRTGARLFITEFLVFGAKQAWACAFGGAMLATIVLAHLFWPPTWPVDRNDALTIVAVLIQVAMLAFGLESFRELRVVVLFHVVGTVMELFKTSVGSWEYEPGGVLHVGPVPLFSGFMYAAVGSYLVRVYRLFDLGFTRYPPVWATALLAGAIYANFFTHHWVWDARYVLLALLVVLFARTTMHVRVHRATLRMPVLLAFLLVAAVIWLAENVATWGGAWFYPAQSAGWEPVAPTKIVAWLLLMTISVVLVTWVYPPRVVPARVRPTPRRDAVVARTLVHDRVEARPLAANPQPPGDRRP